MNKIHSEKILRSYGRLKIIEKNYCKFAQIGDLVEKLHIAAHLGKIQGEKLTLDEYQYLLHHK